MVTMAHVVRAAGGHVRDREVFRRRFGASEHAKSSFPPGPALAFLVGWGYAVHRGWTAACLGARLGVRVGCMAPSQSLLAAVRRRWPRLGGVPHRYSSCLDRKGNSGHGWAAATISHCFLHLNNNIYVME